MEEIIRKNPDEDKITDGDAGDVPAENPSEKTPEGGADDDSGAGEEGGGTDAEGTPQSRPGDGTGTKQNAVSGEVLGLALTYIPNMSIDKAEEYGEERLVEILDYMAKAKAQSQPQDAQSEAEPEKFSLGLTDEQKELLDDETLEALGKTESAMAQIAEQNRKLRQRLDAIESSAVKSEISQKEEKFDSILNGADKELFGTTTPVRGSKEWENRNKVFLEMQVIEAGLSQTGQKVPAMDELVRKATIMAFSDRLTEKARNELTEKIKKRSTQTLLKPSDTGTENAQEAKKEKVIDKFKAIFSKARERDGG
jgi:hypothetical protein